MSRLENHSNKENTEAICLTEPFISLFFFIVFFFLVNKIGTFCMKIQKKSLNTHKSDGKYADLFIVSVIECSIDRWILYAVEVVFACADEVVNYINNVACWTSTARPNTIFGQGLIRFSYQINLNY